MGKYKLPPVPTHTEVRAIRTRLKLTQAEAAAKVGVTTRTWLAWENPSQNRRPSLWHAQQIWLLADGKL